MGTLWNTYAFYILYAEIDQFDPTKYTLDYDKLSVMDKWLLSRLNTAIKEFDENLGAYKIPESANVLSSFVDELSNWYVRRCRERYWAKGMEQDKINAYMTLYTALVNICKCAAPMVPFITESIYQNLVRKVDKSAPESIHLCSYPEVNKAQIDKELEENMDEVLKCVVYGRAARNTANIKNRQPIANMYIKAEKKLDGYFVDIIKDELNMKSVEFRDDVSDFADYSFKPNLKVVGPKYGKLGGAIKNYLAEVNGRDTKAELDEKGSVTFEIDGQTVSLTADDLLIETVQSTEYVTEGDNYVTVVIDTNLTPELIEEGYVREIISKVQSMRKEAGFEVMDKIAFYVSGNDKLAEVVARNENTLKTAVLAEAVKVGEAGGYSKDWDINGEAVTLGVEKQ